jgi:predicted TIM-barrel fold metal-dependent hydrolase
MTSTAGARMPPIIDLDVHHTWSSDAELISFLPAAWRDFVLGPNAGHLPIDAIGVSYAHARATNKRIDAYPENGSRPGSDYDTLRRQLLDGLGVARAVLTFDVGQIGVANPFLHNALARAANDWTIEKWLSIPDDRLFGAMIVPTHQPEVGAAEIRRAGAHERIVEALMVTNGLGKPFGHPIWHPIYEAAVEMELPIAIHPGGDQWVHTTQAAAGGVPPSRFEFHTLSPQVDMFHIASFITYGVFERFPKLKLIVVENGVTWIPHLLVRMEQMFDTMRREVPGLCRRPTEVFREHIRIATQPLELTPRRDTIFEALEQIGGMEGVLVFSSDYPHWDGDDPSYVAKRFPASWWDKLFFQNALDVCRWPKGLPGMASEAVTERAA